MNTLEPIAIELIGRLALIPGFNQHVEAVIQELPHEDRGTLIHRLISRAEFNIAQALETQEDRFKVYTLADAMKPKKPIDWVVENLFPAGTVNLVVGKEGSKKTYSMLDLGICHALGVEWCGLATTQGATLYIDEENGRELLERRLEEVQRGHLADEKTPVFYTSLARFDLRTDEGLDNLEAKIRETGARLVVIDALVDIMPGADENLVKDVNPVFIGLRSIAERTRAALIIIHHENKNGGVRGSSAIAASIDGILNVSSKADSQEITFKTEKKRSGKPLKFSALAYWQDGKFWLSPCEGEEEKTEQLPPSHRFVIKYLGQHGAAQVGEITAKADICSPTTARSALYKLAENGYVERVDNGGNGAGATYDLTAKGRLEIDKLL